MTRYEVIQRFAGDPRSHRDHLVTFLVLAELWVEQGRPDSINLDFADLLRMLDTKRSTLFRWLSQLESFGYIELQRAANQRQKTTVRLTIAHAPTETAHTEVRQQVPKWDSTTPDQPVKPALPIPQPGQQCPKWDGSDSNETANPSLPMPEMRQQVPKWAGSDRNETAEMANTAQNRGFSELSTAATPVLPRVRDHHHLLNKLVITSKDDNQVVNDEKGVQGKKRKRIKRESPPMEKSTFADSTIADIASFREAFANDPTGRTADLDHYHGRLLNWRDRRGNVPERTDWISTARTFMLNDNREGKLVTHQTTPSYVSNTRNSRAHIEPPGNRVFSW